MTKSLPANPSLENLKKQARTLQKAWRAGEAEAIARIRAAHPQYGGLSDEQLRAIQPRLTDCQLVLARETGFESWPQLKTAVQAANRELPNEFVTTACFTPVRMKCCASCRGCPRSTSGARRRPATPKPSWRFSMGNRS